MKSPLSPTRSRVIGAVMATTVAGALALSAQAPSYTQAGTERTAPPAVAKDAPGRSDAVSAAKEYVADHGSMFKKSKDDAFVRTGVHQGTAGTWYVAYERTYRGLPVAGGDFVVAVNKDGKVTATTRIDRLRSNVPNLPSGSGTFPDTIRPGIQSPGSASRRSKSRCAK